MPLTDNQRFLRDVAGLLGAPALLLAGLMLWWRPWDSHPYQEDRSRSDLDAVSAGYRDTHWQGLHIVVPQDYVLTLNTQRLEVIEVSPVLRGQNTWPSRLAYLSLDSAALRRFTDAESACDLAPGRCWADTIGRHLVKCHQSSGVPDPALPWTPHLECQVPDLAVRAAINAPADHALDLVHLFEQAVGTADSESSHSAP
jgi:hypothetical protein